MDLTDKSQLLKYIKENGIWAKKGLSQNFLVDRAALDKIVDSAQIKKDDLVVEIGPGLGTLTQELAKRAGRVIAVEKDEKLAESLSQKSKVKSQNYNSKLSRISQAKAGIPASIKSNAAKIDKSELSVINADILQINLKELIGEDRYKLVANIPYAITSKIIQLFLTAEKKPDLIVMLVQKEVAERICASPGDMSVLAISVQLYGRPEIVDIVPKESFFPSPKVDSAILKISLQNTDNSPASTKGGAGTPASKISGMRRIQKEGEKAFFRCVNIGFSAKRKKLLNNLSSGYNLDRNIVSDIMKKMGLSENVRAQELTIEDWILLSEAMIEYCSSD